MKINWFKCKKFGFDREWHDLYVGPLSFHYCRIEKAMGEKRKYGYINGESAYNYLTFCFGHWRIYIEVIRRISPKKFYGGDWGED